MALIFPLQALLHGSTCQAVHSVASLPFYADALQFEQHLRAVLGLPLGSAALKVGAAAMFNVLGIFALFCTTLPLVNDDTNGWCRFEQQT